MAFIHNETAYANGTKRAILNNARKTWLATTPRAQDIESALADGRDHNDYGDFVGYTDNFVGSLARALDNFGKLTEGQCAAVLKGIDARAAKKAEWAAEREAAGAASQFLGTVGEKITMVLTCVHVVSMESNYGLLFLNICKDDAGNTVIYKGNAQGFPLKGETATVKATVKMHDLFAGVKQTLIQRPKVVTA
jgi:hypothetical protein